MPSSPSFSNRHGPVNSVTNIETTFFISDCWSNTQILNYLQHISKGVVFRKSKSSSKTIRMVELPAQSLKLFKTILGPESKASVLSTEISYWEHAPPTPNEVYALFKIRLFRLTKPAFAVIYIISTTNRVVMLVNHHTTCHYTSDPT